MIGRIAIKFGTMTHFDCLKLSILVVEHFKFLQIQDGERPPFWKTVKWQ